MSNEKRNDRENARRHFSPEVKVKILRLQRLDKAGAFARGLLPALQQHEHWHIDFSCVNIGGTFCYLCPILDGAGR